MEGSTVTTEQTASNFDAVFAKDTWTRDDSRELYAALGQMHSAADRFRARVFELRRDNPDASGAPAVKLGIALYMLGDFQSALATLTAGTDNKDRRWFQAMCCKQLCQYDSAVEEFQRAADRGADDVDVKLAIGECLALGGKFDDAAKLLKKLRARADRSNYHVVRGLLLQAEGQHEQAEEAFGEGLDLDPDNTSAAFRLAFLYDLCGEDAQAVELYTQCLQNPPVSGHALINLAVLYEDTGDWDSAQRCLATLLSVKPGHPRARLFMRDVLSSRTMYYDEDQERRTTQRNAVLDIPVTDFELSVRARNCLKKMNIRTLGDLLNITEVELLAYKNFGETSLTEIKTMLSQKGLRLGQDLEASTIPAGFDGEVTDEAEEQGTANVQISELELSVRSRKALQRLSLTTIADLANCTETQLLACKNFGQTSLNEIKQRLAEHGLNLRARK